MSNAEAWKVAYDPLNHSRTLYNLTDRLETLCRALEHQTNIVEWLKKELNRFSALTNHCDKQAEENVQSALEIRRSISACCEKQTRKLHKRVQVQLSVVCCAV